MIFFYHFRCVFRDDGYKFLNVKFENMKVLVEYPKEDFRRMDKKTGVVRNEDKTLADRESICTLFAILAPDCDLSWHKRLWF